VDIASCGAQRSESEVIDETSTLFSMVEQAVMDASGSVWDPRSEVCQSGLCSTNMGDEWRYLDGSHLSVPMSKALAPALTALVNRQD
jgi:hypothetical protein